MLLFYCQYRSFATLSMIVFKKLDRIEFCDLLSKCIVSKRQERIYSKTCLKRSLKTDKTKIFITTGSLMKVKSIAELEHSAILLISIKQ